MTLADGKRLLKAKSHHFTVPLHKGPGKSISLGDSQCQ